MKHSRLGTSKDSIEDTTLWTREKILRQVGQEDIMEEFLGIPVQYRGHFKSPLRKDKEPTCSFKWVDNKLLFRDWSEPRSKDCFDIVKEQHSCDFYTAMQIVANRLNLTRETPREGFRPDKQALESYKRHKNNEKSIIEVKRQRLTSKDIRYLKSYHLTHKITKKYNVHGIYSVWLNGKLFYTTSSQKPALGYYFGEDEQGRQKWKIYFYQTTEKWRFIGNTNRINGWVQLPKEGKLLIITKSLKDVMCLARFGIPSIAMQAETQIPYDYIIEELQQRFQNIYTLLDYDRTGVISANKIYKLYDIPALFFKDDYDVKDFSDYLKKYGVSNTTALVAEALKSANLDPSNFKLPT
jgi:hypothetical protein